MKETHGFDQKNEGPQLQVDVFISNQGLILF
jgi:hypothetical protein